MALHNPVLEASAKIQHALSDKLVSLDFCRRWCADNKAKALKAIEIAAKEIDDLRAWSQIPPAEFRPPIEAAEIPGIENTLTFLSDTARDLRACHLPHLAGEYDRAAQLIERFSGIPASNRRDELQATAQQAAARENGNG